MTFATFLARAYFVFLVQFIKVTAGQRVFALEVHVRGGSVNGHYLCLVWGIYHFGGVSVGCRIRAYWAPRAPGRFMVIAGLRRLSLSLDSASLAFVTRVAYPRILRPCRSFDLASGQLSRAVQLCTEMSYPGGDRTYGLQCSLLSFSWVCSVACILSVLCTVLYPIIIHVRGFAVPGRRLVCYQPWETSHGGGWGKRILFSESLALLGHRLADAEPCRGIE